MISASRAARCRARTISAPGGGIEPESELGSIARRLQCQYGRNTFCKIAKLKHRIDPIPLEQAAGLKIDIKGISRPLPNDLRLAQQRVEGFNQLIPQPCVIHFAGLTLEHTCSGTALQHGRKARTHTIEHVVALARLAGRD